MFTTNQLLKSASCLHCYDFNTNYILGPLKWTLKSIFFLPALTLRHYTLCCVSVEAFSDSQKTPLMGLSSRFTSGPFHSQSVFPRKMWFPGLKRGGGWGKEGERESDLWSKHAQTLEFRDGAAGAKTVETEARPGQPEHEHAACVCGWLVLLPQLHP